MRKTAPSILYDIVETYRQNLSLPKRNLGLVFILYLLLPLSVLSKSSVRTPVVQRIFTFSEENMYRIGHFESQVYLKFHLLNDRKNIAMRFIPFAYRQERGKNTYLGESYSQTSFSAPSIIDQKETAFYSTMPYVRNLNDLVSSAININLYQSTLMTDRVLSPLIRETRRFYQYRLDTAYMKDGKLLKRVYFTPRVMNMQLAKGYVDVVLETGEVRSLYWRFKYNTQKIYVLAEMGDGEDTLLRLLPKYLHVNMNFNFLKNKSIASIDIFPKYTNILPYNKEEMEEILHKNGHDLTLLNQLNIDTTKTIHDLSYFNKERPTPLTAQEDSIYRQYQVRISKEERTKEIRQNRFSDQWDEIFLGNHYLHLSEHNLLKLPPLITPSMAEWSHSKGLSLRTRIQAQCDFNNGKHWQTGVVLGYNFRRKEFFWRTPNYFLFSPHHNGTLSFEMGNGNKIYNSVQAEDVRHRLRNSNQKYDSLLNVFDKYAFNYYNDMYIKAGTSYQFFNGMTSRLSLVYHKRSLVEWNDEAEKNGLKRHCRSFAPNLYLEWTPGQYYFWKDGHRQPLFSHWPTLSAEYERGLKWVKSGNEYERWEFEAKQSINFHALRLLYLRFGGGFYTNKQNTYFLDYSNFRYNSLPSSWLDKMNGQFETLDSRWYNESNYYVRACASYESPLLLLAFMKPCTPYIKRECLYCNLLAVRSLNPYVETGYSIRTHLFNVGFFMGFSNKKSVRIGWNFSLSFFENN